MESLLDFGILGSGDNIICHTFINCADKSLQRGMSEDYIDYIRVKQYKMKDLRLGYVPGIIRHYFHGKKVNRKYLERDDILEKNQYSPYKHMIYNDIGLIVPTNECLQEFLNDILDYFKNRNEDDMVEEEIKNKNSNVNKQDLHNKTNILIQEKLLTEQYMLRSKSLEYNINFIFDYFVKNKKISI